ncbi:MAG: hypothetical protein ACRC0V_05065, partial [Fusobacteriaceae bacterium]
MRVKNIGERSFYEIESLNNNWSLRELKRQMDTSSLSLLRDNLSYREGIWSSASKKTSGSVYLPVYFESFPMLSNMLKTYNKSLVISCNIDYLLLGSHK